MADDFEQIELNVTLGLGGEQAAELKRRAAAAGMNVGDYVGRIVEDLSGTMTRDKGVTDRVAFDESIYKRALLAPYGPEATCVAYAQAGHCELVVTKTLVKHLRRELRDDNIPPERAARLLQYLKKEVARNPLRTEPQNYRKYCLDLAIENRGVGITLVTHDHNVREWADVGGCARAEFVLRYPQIRVADPQTFLIERADEVSKFQTATVMVPNRREREQAHVLDVARRAGETSRLSRLMDRFRNRNNDKGQEK